MLDFVGAKPSIHQMVPPLFDPASVQPVWATVDAREDGYPECVSGIETTSFEIVARSQRTCKSCHPLSYSPWLLNRGASRSASDEQSGGEVPSR